VLTLAAPWWLLGLALLPALRWLHRFGRHRRAVMVPRAALWSGADDTGPSGRERQPPDPAWRRRALILALLCIALSEPRSRAAGEALTIWVDDSLSMLTRETQGTRLALGLDAARALIAQHGYSDVQVRTLSDPWHNVGPLTPDIAASVATEARRHGLVDAPPGALLQRNRSHWLITDGAHTDATAWASGSLDRVIRVGSVDRNVGLELLAARRNLQDPAQLDVQITVRNGGTAAEHRELLIRAGNDTLRAAHDLEPGATTFVAASVKATDRIQARLSPNDALPDDDEIELDLSALRRHPIAVDSSCPPVLRAAIAAHPALQIVDAHGAAEAALDCGSGATAASASAPSLRALHDRMSTLATGPLVWSSTIPPSRRVALDIGAVRIASRIETMPGDITLLAIGNDAVIVRRTGTGVIDSAFDFAAPEAAREPATALIVDVLVEQLFGADLLDTVSATDRGSGSARVVPTNLADSALGMQTPTGAAQRDNTWLPPIVLVAILTLLWEVVALGMQWQRLRLRSVTDPI